MDAGTWEKAAFSHSFGHLVRRRPWSPPLVLLARPNWSHLSQRVQKLVLISIVGTTRQVARAAPDDPAAAVTIALSSAALTRRWRWRDFKAQVEGRGAKRSDERGMCDWVAPCLPLNREETMGKGESGVTYLRIWPSLSLEAVAGSPPTSAAAAYFEFQLCAVGPSSIGSGRKCCICASWPRSIPKWVSRIGHQLEACFPCFMTHFGYGAPNEALVGDNLTKQ
jgi:hypothetical protein